MNPKIRIASSVVSIGLAWACALPAPAGAGTLLSGYGGPGAGEQAVIGSTLLNAPHGGSVGGSSLGSNASGEGLAAGSGSGAVARGGGSSSAGSSGASTGHSSGSKGAAGGQQTGVASASEASQHRGNDTYIYPSALRSKPASPPLGISGGDLAVVSLILVALAVLAAVTFRAGRLQQ